MSNRLSNYSTTRYTFTIGEIAARGNLAAALSNISLTFADNTVFMTGDNVADILAEYTGKYYISMVPASGPVETDFIDMLTTYWNERRGDYKDMYDALTAVYNPIENYKARETSLDGKRISNITDDVIRTGSHKTTETPSGASTVTTTPSGGTKTTETPTGTETDTKTYTGGKTTTSTESRTTYDDTSSFKPTVKTEVREIPNTNDKETTERAYTNRKTETTEEVIAGSNTRVVETFEGRKTETDTTYNNLTDSRTISHGNDKMGTIGNDTIRAAAEVNEHYFERSGNIGVTTSQQMITSEIELRYLYNLWYMFMREFITRFTY